MGHLLLKWLKLLRNRPLKAKKKSYRGDNPAVSLVATKRGSRPCFEVQVADVLIGVHQLMGNGNCITPFICWATDFEPSAAQVASGDL